MLNNTNQYQKFSLFAPTFKEAMQMITDAMRRGFIIYAFQHLNKRTFCVHMKG